MMMTYDKYVFIKISTNICITDLYEIKALSQTLKIMMPAEKIGLQDEYL